MQGLCNANHSRCCCLWRRRPCRQRRVWAAREEAAAAARTAGRAQQSAERPLALGAFLCHASDSLQMRDKDAGRGSESANGAGVANGERHC